MLPALALLTVLVSPKLTWSPARGCETTPRPGVKLTLSRVEVGAGVAAAVEVSAGPLAGGELQVRGPHPARATCAATGDGRLSCLVPRAPGGRSLFLAARVWRPDGEVLYGSCLLPQPQQGAVP